MPVTSHPELAKILGDLRDVPEIYQPSPFWHELAAAGVRQLEESGFENFKRTVNTRYFNWRLLGIVRHQFFAVARKWARHPGASIFTADFPQPRVAIDDRSASFNGPAAWLYKTYVAMYAEVIDRCDTRGFLRALEEPASATRFWCVTTGAPYRRISATRSTNSTASSGPRGDHRRISLRPCLPR
jgi:hypothetical protein